jgi:hypothetical protein
MRTFGRCRLCERERELCQSHIIPKFVLRRQKKRAPTFLRSNRNPNRPVQDSRKIPFLCDDCETLFSGWETEFKREIYDRYPTGKRGHLPYGPWLLRLSWRALKATLEAGDTVPAEIREAAVRPESTWREFLLNKRVNPGRFSQYLFMLDELADNPGAEVPINFGFYIRRSATAGLWHDPARGSLFTHALLSNMVVIGNIGLGGPRTWGERLHLKKGVIRPEAQIPIEVVDMLKAQAKQHLEMSRGLTERQKKLEEEMFAIDPDKTFESGYLQTMASDVVRAAGFDPKAAKTFPPAILRGLVAKTD